KTGGDISSEWNTALEPSLAQNGSSSSIQMNRNGQMKYNCGADGHYFNRTVVSNGAFISTNGAFYARDGNHPAGKEGILQTDGNVKGLSWATSAGVAQYATTWCTTKFAPKTSDIRLKEGVEAISGEDALAMVNKMKPVSYKYKTKDNSSWNTGIIAQDIEKLEPRLITTALETLADGTEIEDAKHVGKMDGIYIAAIQQLTKRIEELEAKLAQK
ncbi:tail fiber domain-containing protein, partial [Herbiconiux daphne]